LQVFAKCGYCGSAFSMDVVHVAWPACPAALSALCRGKEGYATLAFNVSGTHTKKIISCMKSAYGARNDKSISRYDLFLSHLRSSTLWADVSYNLRSADGATTTTWWDPYGITDGGYHKWRILQAAQLQRTIADIWM
jgi:hypothetical protein